MLTVIFLFFVALFLISGVFFSLENKRRKAHQASKAAVRVSHPRAERATSDSD